MLERLMEQMKAATAEAGKTERWLSGTAHGHLENIIYRRASTRRSGRDYGAMYAYAISVGMSPEQACRLGSAYANCLAEGRSNAYAIVYASAYSIACSTIGASEEWARAYAQACTHAIAAGMPVRFASQYGHAVADGASPRDAVKAALAEAT